MRFVTFILVSVVVFGVGCDSGSAQKAEEARQRSGVGGPTEIANVNVTQGGTIYLDGKMVTLDVLKRKFASLKQANGTVWYYRENPQEEPPSQAMAVVEAVVEVHLPIKLAKKDFG